MYISHFPISEMSKYVRYILDSREGIVITVFDLSFFADFYFIFAVDYSWMSIYLRIFTWIICELTVFQLCVDTGSKKHWFCLSWRMDHRKHTFLLVNVLLTQGTAK